MGTNARIGLELNDGTIASVHLNYDGYLDHAGKMLLEHYQTPEIVQKLIELGDLSCLGQNLGPGPDDNTNTIAYARDRKEDYSAPDIKRSHEEYIYEYEGYGYVYLYSNGIWMMMVKSKFRPITEVLAKKALRKALREDDDD